jgi:hypothetical protein
VRTSARIAYPSLFAVFFASMNAMPVSAADLDWLPPGVAEGVMQQLQERMTQIDASRVSDPAKGKLASSELVVKFRQQIDRWGPEGVIGREPPLSAIKLPNAKQREPDAMAR